jgi:hypothetical protein
MESIAVEWEREVRPPLDLEDTLSEIERSGTGVPAGHGRSSGQAFLLGTGQPEIERTPRFWDRLFWAWLVLRTALWTVLITLTQPNAPLDLIEWLSWGHEWRWGYHKHPPLAAWMAECFAHLSPGGIWGIYLGAYLTTALALWAVWRLARAILLPRLALVAVLCLDGMIFFNFDAAEFSNNGVLTTCWALVALCFHRALRTDHFRWWLSLGLATGAALLTKYSIAFLLAPMAGFMLLHPQARSAWKRPGPYLALLVAALLFAPHLAWMVRNDFVTIHYALARSISKPGPWNHVTHPLFFLLSQLGRLVPVLLVLVPLTRWLWRWRPPVAEERFDRAFLLSVVLGPVVLLLLGSAWSGMQLIEVWGYPLWSFTGLLILHTLKLDLRGRAFAWTLACWGLVASAFLGFALVKNFGAPLLLGVAGRIHYPGRQLAHEVTRLWMRRFGKPFALVAGDCWVAGNIGCYAPQRPSVYLSPGLDYPFLDPKATPWTNDDDMRLRGGVIVWNAARWGDGLPLTLRQHFPRAEVQPPLILPCVCPGRVKPVRVGLAFVSPH